jgi:hypothetical protein
MKALRLLKPPAAAVDALAEAEAELVRVRAGLEQAEAEAKQLGQAWLTAATQEAAEAIERQRLEFERVAKRAQLLIPQIEARRVAAKAEKQRQGLARHRAAIAAFVPELVAAVEAAARIQVEAIKLREAAVADLGESIVAAHIPHTAFAGMLMPDLCSIWSRDLLRMFAPPAAAAPRVVAPAARPKAAAAKPVVSQPLPKPAPRAPRRDPPPEDPDQVSIVFLRGGVELGDGTTSVVGDTCTMMADHGRLLVLRGCADYVPKEKVGG